MALASLLSPVLDGNCTYSASSHDHGCFPLPRLSYAIWACCFAVAIHTVILRLFCSPLSKFPGPRLAGMSRWFEFYYDVFEKGTYIKKFSHWHKSYDSAVIRIGPDHLHINDLDFYHEVFRMGTSYLKDPGFYESLGVSDTLITTTNVHKHKEFLHIMSPIFSQRYIDRFSPRIAEGVEIIASRLREAYVTGTPTDIQRLFRCLTVDVICEILFGRSDRLVQDESEHPDLLQILDMSMANIWLFRHFPFLTRVAMGLPACMARKLAPGYVRCRERYSAWLEDIADRRRQGIDTLPDGRETLLDLVLKSDPSKAHKQSDVGELIDQALGFMVAGSDTTAYALSCATYYLLTSPDVLRRLQGELRGAEAYTRNHDWSQIRALPYLTAVIKESLRLSTGIPGCLPRKVPPQGAYVGSQFIPGGVCPRPNTHPQIPLNNCLVKTVISITARTIHDNPQIFPNPYEFQPERWLGKNGNDLEQWNVVFSKGPRRCLGRTLAYQELYVGLAYIFCRFDLELFETDASSMEWFDRGVAMNKEHVRVTVTNDHWADSM